MNHSLLIGRLLTVVACMAATVASAQWQFHLDTTFRTQITRVAVASLLPTVEGKVIASGTMRFPGEMSDKLLVGFLPDGTRDEGFYNSALGRVKITPWQDRFYVGTSGAVRRILLPSGQNDQTFRLGYLPIPYFSSVQGGDYHVFPDGRVLISGAHMLQDSIRGFTGLHNLIWFTNEGYLDTTRIHRKGDNVVYRFKELPDGKFICSGTCNVFEGEEVDWIFRIHPDGSTDTTFRTGVFWGGARAYLPLPDGRVYVGGRFRSTQAPTDTLRLVRLLGNGDLDPNFNSPSFGLNGLFNNAFLGASVQSVSSWEGGRLMVTGYFGSVNGEQRGGICMLDSTGALLDAFDGCAVGTFQYQSYHYGSIEGLVPAGDDEHFYIHGSYIGFNDGSMNDPQQGFVSRLRMTELSVEVEEQATPVLRLYPNPASGATTLELAHVPPAASVLLRDALGRVAHQQRVHNHTTTLDLRSLAGGIYTVEVNSGGRRVAVQRLVVGGQ